MLVHVNLTDSPYFYHALPQVRVALVCDNGDAIRQRLYRKVVASLPTIESHRLHHSFVNIGMLMNYNTRKSRQIDAGGLATAGIRHGDTNEDLRTLMMGSVLLSVRFHFELFYSNVPAARVKPSNLAVEGCLPACC